MAHSIPRPTLSRIPGGDIVLPQAKEKHTKDLTKLTHIELMEMKEREGKLLANKSKLARLPDKGKRIQELYDRIITEMERRSNVDEAAALFSELNIAAKAKGALNELEWTGTLSAMHDADPTNDVIDSDDEEEMDPLRIIAKGNMHERKLKIETPEQNLITAEDLAEIATFNSGSTEADRGPLASTNGVHKRDSESTDSASETSVVDAELVAVDVGDKLSHIKSKLKILPAKTDSVLPIDQVEQHVRYLVTKTELQPAPVQREKFKPYKTTISDVHAPEKERMRKKGKHWEITAATPPPLQHKSTQMVSLLDSVQIQEAHLAKLKKLQEEQAIERLRARFQRLKERNIKLPTSMKDNPAFTTYRSAVSTELIEGFSHRFREDDEVHDTLDDDRTNGGVTYTVFE